MSKARDSYRVRQVGHQLPESEVRTIWLFETTPGVSRSKFPVLQHRSGRQEAALQSESQPQKRPLLISFFSAVLWEKITPRSWPTCVSCSVPPRAAPGQWGPCSEEGGAGMVPSLLALPAPAFQSPLILAVEPEHRSPGLYIQDPWSPQGPPCCQTNSTRYLHPRASPPRCPSAPWTVSISQGRGSQGWADCQWSAKRCREMTVTTICSADELFRATGL